MNAAFLLMTSALMVGQAGDKKPAAPPAAAPIVASSSSCGSTCGSDACCEGFGHRLRDRLRSWFSRDCCDTCKPTCHEAKPACDDGCRTKWFNFQPAWRDHCAPACDTCDGPFLSRLRGWGHHSDCGCSTCASGCAGGGCAGTVAAPPVKTEKIEAPGKKMPEAPKGKAQEVRIDTPAAPIAAPSTITVSPAPPVVELAPAPRVEGVRDPF